MVSEQMMAADAKSKMAANLLRLGFIDFFGSWVQCLHGEAETAAKTRQVFISRTVRL